MSYHIYTFHLTGHYIFGLMIVSPRFSLPCRYSITTLALLLLCVGSAKSDTTDERIADRLEQLVSTPAIPQKQLDSLSERLSYLTNLNGTPSDETCHEIAMLKAEIAHAMMNGGRSIHMTNLFVNQSSCQPHHGLYDFMLGGIAYNTGQFGLSVDKYRSAREALGTEDQASVMIQLNLSAALEGASRQAEAIDSLNAMLNGEHWKAAPGLANGLYNASIAINAAAIMISEKRYTEALDLLGTIDASNLSEYWRSIQLSNEYIAMFMSAQFQECDSLWAANFRYLPFSEVPLDLFEYTLGSWLATDAIDYMELLVRDADVTNQLLEKEGSVLFALLAPQLSDSARKQHWDILKVANQLERERMKDVADSHKKSAREKIVFEGLQEKLKLVTRTSDRWQLTALVLGLFLLSYVSMRRYFKLQSEKAIRAAVQAVESKRLTSTSLKLEITQADIRKIHMGLTKGHQIGEALLSLQKVEVLHKHTSAAPNALDSINGITDLSESEFTILLLSLDGISNKEIAHQLQVSSGYVYNSRSAIRKKLDIPKESSIRQWIQKQTS